MDRLEVTPQEVVAFAASWFQHWLSLAVAPIERGDRDFMEFFSLILCREYLLGDAVYGKTNKGMQRWYDERADEFLARRVRSVEGTKEEEEGLNG